MYLKKYILELVIMGNCCFLNLLSRQRAIAHNVQLVAVLFPIINSEESDINSSKDQHYLYSTTIIQSIIL